MTSAAENIVLKCHPPLPESALMAQEEMTVREAAELLRVSEKTVYRWIRQGVIPAFRVQGQYRFDRRELQSWARYKRIGAPGAQAEPAAEEQVDLLAALQLGGIHYKLEGRTPAELLSRAVGFFPFAPGFSAELKAELTQTLLEREALHTTAIGHGIALPHPRHPRDWGLGEPALAAFFTEEPTDFGAPDGEPVFVLFVLLCTTIKGHLRMLSQVSHLVSEPEMRAFLGTHPSRSQLMDRIAHALAAPPEGAAR